jgi:hypothetical protein
MMFEFPLDIYTHTVFTLTKPLRVDIKFCFVKLIRLTNYLFNKVKRFNKHDGY